MGYCGWLGEEKKCLPISISTSIFLCEHEYQLDKIYQDLEAVFRCANFYSTASKKRVLVLACVPLTEMNMEERTVIYEEAKKTQTKHVKMRVRQEMGRQGRFIIVMKGEYIYEYDPNT